MDYYFLDPAHTDPVRIRSERAKARILKKTNWWRQKVGAGICHYCQKKTSPKDLTMDHIVPIARGGQSSKGNLVPSCLSCNREKSLETPADRLLRSNFCETN